MSAGGRASIGLDIGGQGIKGCRLEADGRVSLRASLRTPVEEGPAAILRAADRLLSELLGPGPVLAVGIGTPGAVDADGRIAADAVNIPGWRGTELGAAAARSAGAPAVVRNDGNLAAYAEWAVRGGASRALLFVGLGTGIGGGFIDNGHLLGGTDDKAVEIGHVIASPGGRRCACERLGCVEAYASGPSIARIASELALSRSGSLGAELALSRSGLLAARILASGGATTAREVYDAFAAGDDLAREVHAIAADALARGIAAALALLAPDTVVLGGGVMDGAGALVEDVAALVPGYVYAGGYAGCRFEEARLGSDAGVLGAAMYAAGLGLSKAELLDFSRGLAAVFRESGF